MPGTRPRVVRSMRSIVKPSPSCTIDTFASVLALALPPIVGELHASVRQAAAVLGVYALALAIALPPAAALRRALGAGRAGAAGFALMALASVGCALAGSVTLLLVFRALQ